MKKELIDYKKTQDVIFIRVLKLFNKYKNVYCIYK